jgi:hypothetical protein
LVTRREREVVSLELDDIDWEAGTLRIRKSKSLRVDVLPLPQGEAADANVADGLLVQSVD